MYANQRLGRSLSSIESVSTPATVRHHKIRSFSTSSLSSIGSLLSPRQRGSTIARRDSLTSSRRGFRSDAVTDSGQPTLRLVGVEEDGSEYLATEDDSNADASDIHHDVELEEDRLVTHTDTASLDDFLESPEPKTFRRWISTLRRKKLQAPLPLTPRTQRWTLDDFESRCASPVMPRRSQHQQSDSHTSSLAFVTAFKSVTATVASASIATLSRRNSKWRRGQQHSSLFSASDPRPSVDTQRSVMDDAAKQRSLKRREKLEELLRTEEGYVADLKALSNVLYTLLGQHSQSQNYARYCASTTLSKLIATHHDILCQLRQAMPFAEYSRSPQRLRSHARWYSVDGSVPTRRTIGSIRKQRRSLNLQRSSSGGDESNLLCEPAAVTAVASIFLSHAGSFAEYEEFGKHYELVRFAIDRAQNSSANWSEYDNAVETLAHTLNPVQSRDANRHKALTVKDLLIKPIQRLPRYLLLFSDLDKLTPVCDDPTAHAALGRVISIIDKVCERINQSKENEEHKRTFEATWLIGERLNFHNQLPRSAFLKLLGHVELCGCLHIAYRSKDCVKGRYAVCILFETTLLLASTDEDESKYSVLAGIALANATIAECDNGRGLQCHTAPHSWKIVYEHHAKMYEIILTACSAPEASVWRSKVARCASTQAKSAVEDHRLAFELYSPLAADMRSVGNALGKAGSFIRRMSMESLRRAATVANTVNLSQVIIKNTQAVKETLDNPSKASLSMPRSQSVATPSHLQTLAPRRADRVRLEALLSDVWSKDLLPYPGMAPRRSDPIRASANHVMRKFSMASITSNFSNAKRNASHTSISSMRKEDMPPCGHSRNHDKEQRKQSRPPLRPPLVDFHNAPEAFLPEDFDLSATTKRKRSALRTFTLTMERPFSPLLGETKPTGPRRTQSVRNDPVEPPVYTVVQRRANTPAPTVSAESAATADAELSKTSKKTRSMNRLLRMFA